MRILKGILSESEDYYIDVKRKIDKKLKNLPKGSIKERSISGRKYYYLQERKGKKIIHKYLGRHKPEELLKQIRQRKLLKSELRKANEALRIIKRSKGRKG